MSRFQTRQTFPAGEASPPGPASPAGEPTSSPAALPWSGLLTLTTAAFTAVLTEQLPTGLLLRMSADLDVSRASVGFLVSGYAVASCLAAVPLTALLRRYHRRPVLVGVLIVLGLCNAVAALSDSYPLTFAVRLLAGAAGGVGWSMFAGYAARMVPVERQGRAIAIALAGITVAFAAGVPAGTALAAAVGWRAGFATLAALALILAAWVIQRLPDFPGEPGTARLPVRRVIVRPGLRSVFAMTLFLLLGHQAMYTYTAPFVERSRFGNAGLVLFVFGGTTVVGVWVAGLVVDRHPRTTLRAALGLVAVAMLALGLFGRVPPVLLVSFVAWGAAYGAIPTLLQAAVVGACGPDQADVATSIQTTVFNLGIAGGSLAGGVALERAGVGSLPWLALVLVIAAAATAPAVRES
ncbi:MFS transporter [Pseudofrankia sp. BMG5.36]|uniref:MFS transporter n=1 Tax=Pseudofrankia sp. BMG5.36 TaxID=1834512 RepID=UPI0009F4B5AF|nr:MFS transporter [Pseudofrankia sp. BMG5.36]